MKTVRWCGVAGVVLCALLSHSGWIAGAQIGGPICDAPNKEYGSSAEMIKLRTRAWDLLSTIARKPIVDSTDWVPKSDAFAPPKIKTRTKALALFFAAELQSVGFYSLSADDPIPAQPPIYESTFFNQAAYGHIRDEKYPLYSADTTRKLLMVESRREIPEFPKSSVVLKTFWRPVPENGSVNVGVWKWALVPPTAVQKFETEWQHAPVCVEVNPAPNSPCLQAGKTFYTITTTRENAPQFLCVGNNQNCAPQLPKGQTMILVGMHVASKEKPDWFWATFWWQGVQRQSGASPETASWTCDNAQRPPELGTGVWSNYSMDVRTNFKDPKPEVAANDMNTCGSPPTIGRNEELLATYNPFVEGIEWNGRKSSCIDCHSRADTNNTPNQSIPPECPVVDNRPKLEDFEGHIRTDYLWSIRNFLAKTPLQP